MVLSRKYIRYFLRLDLMGDPSAIFRSQANCYTYPRGRSTGAREEAPASLWKGFLAHVVENWLMATGNSAIQHPSPTPTTAKELYGSAVSCGFPECPEPPYKIANGVPELNSQIAHIHSRSENGPRWLATMTPEENRAIENLIILCHFHHGVVDNPANESDYPAALLRQWKAAQVELATSAPAYVRPMDISEAQAYEILRTSEQRDSALLDRTSPLVRAVNRFTATIRMSRKSPQGVTAEWQAENARWRALPVGWDPATGENLYASPPPAARVEYETRIQAALDEVAKTLQPLLIEVETELAAVVSGVADSDPWSLWLRTSVSQAARIATMPDHMDSAEDSILSAALDAVHASMEALVLHLRGLAAPEPPKIIVTEEPPNAAEKMMEKHREVLDRGQPFMRVGNKDFDAALHDELATQTEFACFLPEVTDFLGLALSSASQVAAHVARRGADSDVEAIIAGYAVRKPTAAAVLLLFNLKRLLEEDGRIHLANEALTALEGRAESFGWDDGNEWESNGYGSPLMLDVFANILTAEAVRGHLRSAAEISPELGVALVFALAGTGIQIDPSGERTVIAHFRFPREWLPVEELLKSVAAAQEELQTEELRSLVIELEGHRDRGQRLN